MPPGFSSKVPAVIGRGRAWTLGGAQLGLLLTIGLARGDTDTRDSANVRGSVEASTYSDTDHVLVVSPTVALAVEDPVRGWSASGRYLVDIVSAASADIVSTASPRWHEIRHVGSLEGTYKPGDFGVAPRLSISREPDYLSLGAGLQLTQDFADKAWTVALGYGYGHDTMSLGSTPFSVFSRTLDRHGLSASVSAVVDRATRVTLIADTILERGELAKLYRYVPTFDHGRSVVPQSASTEQINEQRANERVAEHVPDARNRVAMTVRLAHRFTRWTFRGDQRAYRDNWGLLAATTDVRFMADASSRLLLWPHLRWHMQNGVSFWRRVYEITTDASGARHVPVWITGNREQGPQRSLTVGGGVSWSIGPDEDIGRRKLTFTVDGIGTWYGDSLFLQQRYGVFSALTFDAAFN